VQIAAALAAAAQVLSDVETVEQMQLQIPVAAVVVHRPDVPVMVEVVAQALSLSDTQHL
jgi:hypothetical protein